jgi:uncharacterized protein
VGRRQEGLRIEHLPLLILLTLVAAVLYSSVGHGGASGYLAAMALVGAAPAMTKPTALILNILVAGVGTIRYLRAGCFDAGVFWPFAVGAVPFAFLGGATAAPDDVYRRILGIVLLVAALGLVLRKERTDATGALHPAVGIAVGAGIGFLSGVIGVGGGIFLSPLLIYFGVATTRQTLGIAALFILLNSAAGLLGHIGSLQAVPREAALLAPTALVGGLVGTYLGAKRLAPVWLRGVLTVVLTIAALKLLSA